MSRNAFVGRAVLWIGLGGSPQNFVAACETFGMSGIGKTNDQIDSTDFCSGDTKEYIGGLADGSEVTLELNLMADTAIPALEIQSFLINAVDQKEIVDFQVRVDQNGDGLTDMTVHFSTTMLGYTFNFSPTAKNSISFSCKISGDLDITTP